MPQKTLSFVSPVNHLFFLIRINNNCSGPPVVDRGLDEMEVLVGDFVILTCKVVSGTGKINVRWVVDGQPVSFGQLSPTVLVSMSLR